MDFWNTILELENAVTPKATNANYDECRTHTTCCQSTQSVADLGKSIT